MRTVSHHERSVPIGVARSARRSVGRFLCTERREDGQRVDVVCASAEDGAPQTTKRRWSAQEEVGGTSPIVPERPVVAVVGEKSNLSNDEQAHHVSSRRRRHQTDSVEKRAERARTLFHLGELSAARAQVAPGTLATLRELTNPERRPPRPRQQLSEEVIQSTPSVSFELSQLLICLRTARRGAPPPPSVGQ